MPIYEFRCLSCGKKCELLMSANAEFADEPCPHCGQAKLSKLVSRFRRGRSDDDRIDHIADQLETMGEPGSASEIRELVKEIGRATDDDMADDLEEMLESDLESDSTTDNTE
ncbi:MAG: zinc ribbon domain-containing protein [Fimbriimonadaceae bacterium]|nr:zinc ribbon domain-containing protein [Fimbriimonadaceae bacterium]